MGVGKYAEATPRKVKLVHDGANSSNTDGGNQLNGMKQMEINQTVCTRTQRQNEVTTLL